jgi:hypothetical protein
VVAIFDQNLRESEGQTEHPVDVPSDEQDTAGLIRNRQTVRKLRCGAESVQDRFLVVRAWNAGTLIERLLPLVSSLIVYSVEHLVKDGLDDGPEVR